MAELVPKLTVAVDYGDIPGKPILRDTVVFDGTPAGFDVALEQLRAAFHLEAKSGLRPCGHPGPWHTGGGAT